MKRKLGTFVGELANCSDLDALHIIKDIGFDSFFTAERKRETVLALREEADRLGLDFEFIHAPFRITGIHINKYWEAGIDYRPLFNSVIETIDSAAEAGVKTIVHHVAGSFTAPQMTDFGIARFDRTVEYAVKKGVRIAFENLQHLGNLTCLMERYHNIPEVGFCFDCGHANCYTPGIPWLDILGKRTFCTHIHDNYGLHKEDPRKDADYHLLPFEGDIDYAEMMRKLDEYGYEGSLMLEVGQHRPYDEMTTEEFFKTSYDRIKKISEL